MEVLATGRALPSWNGCNYEAGKEDILSMHRTVT